MSQERKLPRISVCLLTYKRAQLLPKTLESLLAQDHTDFELIINDDRSPDDTEQVCREFAQRDSRIRYFRNVQNLRYANNQNAAILRAKHEHVAIVHDSDLYKPQLLSCWTQALVDHPSAALVFNQTEQLNAAREVVGTYKNPYPQLVRGRDMVDDMLSRPDSPIFGIVMVRRSRVLEAGPFDPRLPTLGDVDMWLRLLLRYDAAYVAQSLYSIAPREPEHHNVYYNWSIRRESELIYEMNWRRRYASEPDGAENARRIIARNAYRERALCLAACLRHARWRAALSGLQYIASEPPIGARVLPESVLTWGDVERVLEQLGHAAK
ncbi:MAG TPA: glycosyltransferase family 2 protein [Polyangiales bacterium]|nr:glycosyltransferase family 2 protein [Polyangiales bacterium]